MNKGMSLLEVIIGMALFSILMVLVIETTLSIRDFSASYEEGIELEEEGRRIIKQVTSDFSNSAWYKNSGSTFPIAIPITTMSQQTYGNSVKFLRLRSHGTELSQVGIAPFDFKTPMSLMSEWKTPRSTMSGLIVNPDFTLNTSEVLVSPVWEPIERLRTVSLNYDENRTLSNLRIYEYYVESSANNSIGRGVLKRRYFEEGVEYPDLSIGDLGRHIHWFIIQPDLNTQQVRLFLELRGPDRQLGKTVAIRRFSVTIAMRSVEPSN